MHIQLSRGPMASTNYDRDVVIRGMQCHFQSARIAEETKMESLHCSMPLCSKNLFPKHSLVNRPKGMAFFRERGRMDLGSAKYKIHVMLMDSQNTSKPKAGPLQKLCDAVEDFIDDFMQNPSKPWTDPKLVLAGNFAPVEETPPVECPNVEGILPECMEGVYIRNGPNPRFIRRSGHHYFEGDGMLHALTIKGGKCTFCSRYVRTNKFVQEAIAGRSIFPRVFSGFHGSAGVARLAVLCARIATGQIDPFKGFGHANTSVLLFDKLMALEESDLPYAVNLTENGDVQTVGRYDFQGKLSTAMTAHAKVDPDTGELFAFGYSVTPPFLKLFRVEPGGGTFSEVPVLSLRRPSLMHDFALTKKYAIFSDTQIAMSFMHMAMGKGSLATYESRKVPRLGIIPRYADKDSAMKWLDVPGLNMIHVVNAWDEGEEEVVVVGSNPSPIQHAFDRPHLAHCAVERISINMRSGRVQRRALSSKSLDFGVINRRFVSKKNRYAYMSVGAPFLRQLGVVKVDWDCVQKDCVVACRIYGGDRFGSEPFFVAHSSDSNAEEDEGYVMAFLHNERRGTSKMVVMDARSPCLEIVASIHIPRRIPYGFHGLFVARIDLQKHCLCNIVET